VITHSVTYHLNINIQYFKEMKNYDCKNDDILDIISKYTDITASPVGKQKQIILEIEKNCSQNSNIHLVSAFEKEKTNESRIGTYIVILNEGDKINFSDYTGISDRDLYVVINGLGEYIECSSDNSIIRKSAIQKGNVTSNQGKNNFHTIINTSDEPLIIFMVTANEIMI